MRSGYVNLLIARAAVETARELEALGLQLRSAAEARVRAGAAGDIELRLAETEVGRLGFERVAAELEVARGRFVITCCKRAGSPQSVSSSVGRSTDNSCPRAAMNGCDFSNASSISVDTSTASNLIRNLPRETCEISSRSSII